MYARNAGIIGNIHGATNDPNPARIATASVTSAMYEIPYFSFKGFFHICPQFKSNPFITMNVQLTP